MKAKTTLKELVKMSKTLGQDKSLVLGGFGNTSVKTDDQKYMYVKASGAALKDMTEKNGYVVLKLDRVRQILDDKTLATADTNTREINFRKALLASLVPKLGPKARPSIESCFHSLLAKYVVHLHPIAILAYACSKNGAAELDKLFSKTSLDYVWVPFADVGYRLANKIKKAARDYKKSFGRPPSVFFLQNHGLLVSTDSLETGLKLVKQVVDTCRKKLKTPKVCIRPCDTRLTKNVAAIIGDSFEELMSCRLTVKHFLDQQIAAFLTKKNAPKLCSSAALTVDELLYCGGPPMWLEKYDRQTILNKLKRLAIAKNPVPAAFLIKSLGLFVVATKDHALIKDITVGHLSIRVWAHDLGGIHTLARRQRNLLLSLGVLYQQSGANNS